MTDTLQLRVTGMTCGGCENAVRRTLLKVSGVASVTASHAQDSVRVIYDPDKVTPAVIRNAIQTLGYTAQP